MRGVARFDGPSDVFGAHGHLSLWEVDVEARELPALRGPGPANRVIVAFRAGGAFLVYHDGMVCWGMLG